MKFNIECEMEDRWANDFCYFLLELQHNGVIGHSSLIGFFADGDGDFRPRFNFIDYTPNKDNAHKFEKSKECECYFDAG